MDRTMNLKTDFVAVSRDIVGRGMSALEVRGWIEEGCTKGDSGRAFAGRCAYGGDEVH